MLPPHPSPPPAKVDYPDSRGRHQALPGDRITSTADGHWTLHGPKEWVTTPRQTAAQCLAAWHQRPACSARSRSPCPSVPDNQKNVWQSWVEEVCEPTAATFKRPFPSISDQFGHYSTDDVATFCDRFAMHHRTPPTFAIPEFCERDNADRLIQINLDLDDQGMNPRPICLKWQLSGHQGCFKFCATGLHHRGRGCTSNPNGIHLCMYCCGFHSLVMCPHIDGEPHK